MFYTVNLNSNSDTNSRSNLADNVREDFAIEFCCCCSNWFTGLF